MLSSPPVPTRPINAISGAPGEKWPRNKSSAGALIGTFLEEIVRDAPPAEAERLQRKLRTREWEWKDEAAWLGESSLG